MKQSSYGEEYIKELLDSANIKYEREKTFDDLRFETGYFARFDFYLPDYNVIIEYDGKQHFIEGKSVFDNPEQFAITQEHDKIKNDYCKSKGIKLVRIPYTMGTDFALEDIL